MPNCNNCQHDVANLHRVAELTHRYRLRLRVIVTVAVALIGVAGSEAESRAGDNWMFRRSYFSHTLPEGVKIDYPRPDSRSAYRRAYVGANPGFSIRGGYRFNTVRLQAGNSVDTTIIRDSWFEIQP